MAAAAALSGCLTTSADGVRFETTPEGALVELSNGARCVTPCALELAKGAVAQARITAVGFHPVTRSVRRHQIGVYAPAAVRIEMDMIAPIEDVSAEPLPDPSSH